MPELPAIVFALVMQRAPVLEGWATWYGIDDGSGVVFRNGEAFRLDAPYCAVDASLWGEMAGARLYVQAGGRLFSCPVADTGRLRNAGLYDGLPFVLDLPAHFF